MGILIIISIILMDLFSADVDFPWWAYLIVLLAWIGVECVDFLLELL